MSSFVISPYCTEWPKFFLLVRDELLAVFISVPIIIEHIGSTAVPGLAAKPVVDVLLGADSLEVIEARINVLSKSGYSYVSKYERELPTRRYFVKSSDAAPRVHLHAVQLGSRLWQEHLFFRNALREDFMLRDRYQSLKLRLAKEYADDKQAYTASKHPFIQSVLAGLKQSDVGSEK
jgi:GrpB-like predicted nucleotidyltransferase (UPF0157 family)